MSYQPKVYIEQGAHRQVVGSGGSLDVVSGGELDIESGGALKLAGTEMTATAAELNAIADVSVNGGIIKVKKIAISSTPTGSEQDTTFDLPAKSVLLDVFVDVTTAEATGATKTLDVGLLASESGGDADGFLDGISVAATGLAKGNFAATVGSNNSYLGAAGTHTLGAKLTGLLIAGEDTTAGGDGVAVPRPHMSTAVTAKSVSFTAGSNDWAEFRGALYLVYLEIG